VASIVMPIREHRRFPRGPVHQFRRGIVLRDAPECSGGPGAPSASVIAAVGVTAMRDVDDRHRHMGVIDPVDDAVGTAPGAVTVGQRWA